MKYLFIGGCARSGTTALWRVIAKQQSAVIGLERYVNMRFTPNFFRPDLFQEDRFFDVRKGETWYSSIDKVPYYSQARHRYRDAKIVGDKIPNLTTLLPEIFEHFPNSVILYIVRNLFDVANSYQKRAIDPNDKTWPEHRDYQRASEDWNSSLEAAIAWANKLPFILINYEKFFAGQADIGSVANFVELDADVMKRNYETALRAIRPGSEQLALSPLQRQYLALNGNFALYSEVLKLGEKWIAH